MRAVVLGLVTSATITIGFALPHLLQLKNTSPIRVLRHDLPPPQLQAGATYGIAIGMLLVMIYSIVRDLALLGYIAGGLAAVAMIVRGRRMAAGGRSEAVSWRGRCSLAIWARQHIPTR